MFENFRMAIFSTHNTDSFVHFYHNVNAKSLKNDRFTCGVHSGLLLIQTNAQNICLVALVAGYAGSRVPIPETKLSSKQKPTISHVTDTIRKIFRLFVGLFIVLVYYLTFG